MSMIKWSKELSIWSGKLSNVGLTVPNAINITLNETQKFQTIIGFGGAFTDAAGINLAKLSPGAQQNLIRSYYGPEGIGYTLGRTPMASCDFSAREYSYDDVDGDFNLTNFALTQEDYIYKVYSDPDAYKIVDGLAIHWYADQSTSDIVDPYHLTDAHNAYPDKFLLYTEVLQHWVTGWTDWNICLDPQGGPNWVNNWCDSPIIVSNTTDEFEKQPMYYGLGHFAKFIVPDSVIIGLNFEGNTNQTNLEAIAALNPSGQKVVVLNNRDVASTYQISVINKQGSALNLAIEPRSFTTIVWSE
uniref:Glucosylceramidase n=1 Tax=Acrobeloides nanus TaxID=290746 RepID=A0A914E1J5_9BILA